MPVCETYISLHRSAQQFRLRMRCEVSGCTHCGGHAWGQQQGCAERETSILTNHCKSTLSGKKLTKMASRRTCFHGEGPESSHVAFDVALAACKRKWDTGSPASAKWWKSGYRNGGRQMRRRPE